MLPLFVYLNVGYKYFMVKVIKYIKTVPKYCNYVCKRSESSGDNSEKLPIQNSHCTAAIAQGSQRMTECKCC